MEKITSRAILGALMEALNQSTGIGWVDAISTYVPSDQDSEEYGWLGHSPVMQEWVGGKKAKDLKENSYIIRNKLFEATLKIPVPWLRRDKFGMIELRIADLVARSNSHYASLLTAAIEAGETTLCYDGQYFFDTDHVSGDSGTQSNDLSIDISALATELHGSTTNPSVEELQKAILTGCQQIIGFKDDQGEPKNENARKFLVMVPVSLWQTTAAALGASVIDGGKTNVIQAPSMDGFEIGFTANARLSWNDKFAVFNTDSSVKSLVRQEEEDALNVSALSEGSDHAFKNNEHLYSVEASRNVGYGHWDKACLCKLI